MLCFTESSLNYKANHQGLYDGVCGVNPDIWNDYLADKGVHYNSLQGGLLVYKYYLKKTKNKRDALLRFKGVVKNEKVKKIVDKILVLEKELR